jgi:hypothetical protein
MAVIQVMPARSQCYSRVVRLTDTETEMGGCPPLLGEKLLTFTGEAERAGGRFYD